MHNWDIERLKAEAALRKQKQQQVRSDDALQGNGCEEVRT